MEEIVTRRGRSFEEIANDPQQASFHSADVQEPVAVVENVSEPEIEADEREPEA